MNTKINLRFSEATYIVLLDLAKQAGFDLVDAYIEKLALDEVDLFKLKKESKEDLSKVTELKKQLRLLSKKETLELITHFCIECGAFSLDIESGVCNECSDSLFN